MVDGQTRESDADGGPSVAWVGLGKLGLPMAARLAAAGTRVRGFDPASERSRLAESRGIRVAGDLPGTLSGASVVFTSLPDDRALLQAALDIFPSLEPGAIVVDTSTVSAHASAEAADRAAGAGAVLLRAPVSGNPVLAEAGTLTVLASGPRPAFDATRAHMAAFSRAQHWLGEGEQARYAKLAINLMIAVSAGMMAEALTLAEKGGLDRGAMLDVLADSAVGSPMVKYKAPPLKDDDYTSTFSCRQMAKDLDLILGAMRADGVPAPLAAQMRESYTSLIATGEGDEDFIATVRQARRLAGIA